MPKLIVFLGIRLALFSNQGHKNDLDNTINCLGIYMTSCNRNNRALCFFKNNVNVPFSLHPKGTQCLCNMYITRRYTSGVVNYIHYEFRTLCDKLGANILFINTLRIQGGGSPRSRIIKKTNSV